MVDILKDKNAVDLYKVESAWGLLLTSHWQTFQYYFLYKAVLMS